jgi:cobalt-zinc-cadmium efflux system membrane fusion protein
LSLEKLWSRCPDWLRAALGKRQTVVVVAVLAVAAGAGVYASGSDKRNSKTTVGADTEVSSQSKRPARFVPTAAQWASLGIEPCKQMAFRSEITTEGKIGVNEDRSTSIFPPYVGRVTRVLVKAGDDVQQRQPLFYIEATDMVNAQNNFLAAVAGLNKAKSAVTIAEIIEKQNRTLYESKAGPLRDYQTAQATLVQVRSDQRNAEAALEASRNNLSILGKTDEEITAFQESGKITSDTPIYAPLAGTVVSRKVGPGQYVSYISTGAVDPVFVIGDLSTVWIVAYVRETDAPKVRIGQRIEFTMLAFPNQTFNATIEHVSASLDPSVRRLMVRATIDNADRKFKPEMFATVTLYSDEGETSVAVPRESVIYEAETARVWVVRPDKTLEVRQVKTGITRAGMVQVVQGLQAGESVVTKGSLFVDQAAGT